MCDSPCWYKDGLHFSCTGCGRCCTGNPGYVWVSKEEIAQIATHLQISIDLCMRRYIRQKELRLALIELPKRNYDCVFLENNRCTIYPVRPRQCQTFPWWKEVLSSEKSWEETAQLCNGISPEKPLVSYETIMEQFHSF
jgi:uncharacterized protein